MKKSTRILAILMAFAVLMGSFSVMGSAYQAYKGDTIKGQYNDVDAVDFTLEQYASMGLDEVDRMLAKEKMVLDVFIGTLDLGSIDTTLDSVQSLLGSVESLLPLLEDASALPGCTEPIKTIRRSNANDVDVIYALLDFIGNLGSIVEKYVNGTIDLGILDGFIADFKFDVRNLAIGIIYGMTSAGKAADFDAFSDDASKIPDEYTNVDNGARDLLQDALNELVLGEWKQLDKEFNDPYSYVMYESYSFMEAPYNETKYNTEDFDYYGWVHPKHWVTTGLGGCVRVPAGDPAPAPIYDVVDITTNKTGYVFIENLMQAAYNQILIPVLNRDTRKWVRELCGVVYEEQYTKRTIYGDDPSTPAVEDVWYNNPDYNPSYDGIMPTAEELAKNEYAKFLNVNARAYTVDIPSTSTFVNEFNNTLGKFLDNVLAVKRNVANDKGYSWTWIDGGNEHLFTNICSAGKFIIATSGNLFFSEHVDVPDPETIYGNEAKGIPAMTNQQVVAFIMRAILNSSVDWMYIEDEYQSVAEVGYRAVEQLAWQDIPEQDYTKPEESNYATIELYYEALVDKALDILFDVAVYNLNQGIDMVPGEGLLEYGGDNGSYETNLIQIVAWATSEYGAILNIDFFCDDNDGKVTGNRKLTANDVWMDIDSILDSLIPIKGAKDSWISSEISGIYDEGGVVVKSLIFDYLLKPIYTLNSTNLAEIFARNTQGQFSKDNGIKIIMTLLTNIFELLFPGVFQPKDTIDKVLDNNLLGSMVGNLVRSLSANGIVNPETGALYVAPRGKNIAQVALPVVCMLLGLSDDQEFEEMEIFIDEAVPSTAASSADPTFQIYNGSSGINTAYHDASGKVQQDKLYTYKVTEIFANVYKANGTTGKLEPSVKTGTLAGGDSMTVSLTGTRTEGDLVEVTVLYNIYGEDGGLLTEATLSNTVYTYVGATNKDDSEIEATKDIGGKGTFEYYPSIYLSAGDGLDDIEGYSIRIQDNADKAAGTATVTGVSNASTEYPFATINSEAKEITASMTGEDGVFFLYPFDVAAKDAEGNLYERFELNYEKDEEGNTKYDEETGEPIPDGTNNAGVPDGQYNVTTKVSAHGASYDITTMIHLYDDFDLESIFNRAVAANRQESDYKTGYNAAWNAYDAALKQAAKLVLKPKNGVTFQSDIAIDASTGYTNKYEKYAEDLSNAIVELEKFAKNEGTSGLKTALAQYSGTNYTIETNSDGYPYRQDIEYDDPAYTYFGMRDYVPHTYNRYKDARNRVEDLIASQEIFVMAPFEEGYEPTEEDLAAYAESVKAYTEAVENMDVIGSIEATYAIHMLNLMGGRLIRLEGDTDKLDMLYKTYGNAKEAGKSYTEESEERYDRAVAFADKVLKESDPRPSKINKATSELVAAWKKLSFSASYVALDNAIAAAKAVIDVVGTDADRQKVYTADSYKAFLTAYDAAINAEKDLSDTQENNAYLGELTENLTTAQANLATATSTEAKFEFVTEDPGVFMDLMQNKTFTPQLSLGAASQEVFMTTLEDGTMIDNYLVGIGEGVMDYDTLLMAFSTLENVEVIAEANENECYTSGTVVQLKNSSTNEIIATYMIIVVGDLNGDSIVDTSDEAFIYDDLNYKNPIMWMDDPLNSYMHAAGDINNDGVADSGDIPYFLMVANGQGYVDQDVNPDFEPLYVSVF